MASLHPARWRKRWIGLSVPHAAPDLTAAPACAWPGYTPRTLCWLSPRENRTELAPADSRRRRYANGPLYAVTRGDKRLIQIDPVAQPHVLLLNRSLAVEWVISPYRPGRRET